MEAPRTEPGEPDAVASIQPVASWALESAYAQLPSILFARAEPARFPAPRIVAFDDRLARELGLRADAGGVPNLVRGGSAAGGSIAEFLAGQRLFPGSVPIAQAYAGHQYGSFTMLGDGRAILLGERRLADGGRVDVHLKGAGRTPYSRRGDGRAALGPMLREHLVSGAMHALGIPTSRSLAVVGTGEEIVRDGLRQGAVLVRIAASHVRVGTFQFAAGIDDVEALRALADHAIERHDPRLVGLGDRHRRFLHAVVERSAALVAAWQSVGFVHGVLNTDNLAVSGETIDFGPCAFLDAYDPNAVFSSIDRDGRYRYAHQPRIVQWNLARLAEALVPLLAADEASAVAMANEALGAFPALHRAAWADRFGRRLGLRSSACTGPEAGSIAELAGELLAMMADQRLDFTNAFLALERVLEGADASRADDAIAETHARIAASPRMREWSRRWTGTLEAAGVERSEALATMRLANPSVIPRNHLVEAALSAAEAGDLAPFERLCGVLAQPFAREDPGLPTLDAYRRAAPDGSPPYRTFCGT